MRKIIILFFILIVINGISIPSQEELVKIEVKVSPTSIKQGEEGELSLKITPVPGIRISSNPDVRINFEQNDNLQFSKTFFTGSELEFKTIREKNVIFYQFEDKEKPIRFKVKESSLLGKQRIKGEVVYTAVFEDNWSVKTFQKFNVSFFSRRNRNLKK